MLINLPNFITSQEFLFAFRVFIAAGVSDTTEEGP